MIHRLPLFRTVLIFLLVAAPALLFAQPVGVGSGGGSTYQWDLLITDYDQIVLNVATPDECVWSTSFPNGKALVFNLADLPGEEIFDGEHTYELRVVPRVSDTTKKALARARATGDDKEARRILIAAGIYRPPVQTGAFQVLKGAIVPTDQDTEKAQFGGGATTDATTPGTSTSGLSGPAGRFTPETQDQVIPDDLIVQGSLCVGFDCVNGEAFSFDTIRMKENNLRIKAEDTSVGSFPTNDWQLTFNDSASGGASKFSVDDITGSTTPMTIRAGALTNSLFVSSTGRIGFRTSTPVLDLHVNTSNTPALRLEQNNSGGFTAQTWDVAGNEANFFIRDVTGGSRLPFRIRPGAPTSSIDISALGRVGMGTASPAHKLHVSTSNNTQEFFQMQNSNSGADANATISGKADVAQFDAKVHASGRTISRFGKVLGSWNELVGVTGNGVIVGTNNATPLVLGTNNVNHLEIGAAGGVTITGNLTVTGVKSFAQVDPVDSSRALHYVALEGPEAGTYCRGTAKTVGGVAVIELPYYFSRITENERMTVVLTALGKWGRMYVAEKSPEHLVIKVAEGDEDLEFDYVVQGIRKGYLDFQVDRENTLPK